MMKNRKLYDEIARYAPVNRQEEKDKERMLKFCSENDDCLLRTNCTAHFTASAWIVNRGFTKVLCVYHKIYDSWSWVGGHADGEEDTAQVALRETKEETGIKNAALLSPDIVSIEILNVNGHEKRGEYISSHLHMNLTYLVIADESEELIVKPDENSGVRWLSPEQLLELSDEKWMKERIYSKLIKRTTAEKTF